MSTFKEANQVRLKLKMKYSQYAWYSSSVVISTDDGFGIVMMAHQIDNKIRKLISPVVDGISVKTELE
jgi:hypothetical protein